MGQVGFSGVHIHTYQKKEKEPAINRFLLIRWLFRGTTKTLGC